MKIPNIEAYLFRFMEAWHTTKATTLISVPILMSIPLQVTRTWHTTKATAPQKKAHLHAAAENITDKRGNKINFYGNLSFGEDKWPNIIGLTPISKTLEKGHRPQEMGYNMTLDGGKGATNTGTGPTSVNNMILGGDRRVTKTGSGPISDNNMGLGKDRRVTIMGNRPVFADSMTLGRDKTTKNVGNNTGIGPKFSDSIVPAGGKGAGNMGNRPRFGDSMALGGENMTTRMGNEPVFADSTAWGRDKTTKNVGTIQELDQSIVTVLSGPATNGLVSWGIGQNLVTVWLYTHPKSTVFSLPNIDKRVSS